MINIFFDISFHFFSIYQDAYVDVNSLYIAAFMFVFIVLSVPWTLVEDDEANKV